MYYAAGVLGVFLLVTIPVVFNALYEPASCFDGKQNQGETAIDRGGPCALLDVSRLEPHAVLWARSFAVRDGFYNAVAYIENPNQNAGVFDAGYQFKLYDSRNVLVAERSGRVPIPPGKVFPIFESRIDTGNRIPVRTIFSFTNTFNWERMRDPVEGIQVSNERLSGQNSAPRLDAELYNTTTIDKQNVVVIATIFDTAGNAIAASRTIVPRLLPNEREAIAFTWPHPFTTPVARIDIVPLAVPESIFNVR